MAQALTPQVYEDLSWLERCEARLLLEAEADAGNRAAAWRLLEQQKIVSTKRGSNPSDRFAKRWKALSRPSR